MEGQMAEDTPPDFVMFVAGHRGALTRGAARLAAKEFLTLRRVAPDSYVMLSIAGYDDDPRELHQFPEVCAATCAGSPERSSKAPPALARTHSPFGCVTARRWKS